METRGASVEIYVAVIMMRKHVVKLIGDKINSFVTLFLLEEIVYSEASPCQAYTDKRFLWIYICNVSLTEKSE